jgi:hypothetical protein
LDWRDVTASPNTGDAIPFGAIPPGEDARTPRGSSIGLIAGQDAKNDNFFFVETKKDAPIAYAETKERRDDARETSYVTVIFGKTLDRGVNAAFHVPVESFEILPRLWVPVDRSCHS